MKATCMSLTPFLLHTDLKRLQEAEAGYSLGSASSYFGFLALCFDLGTVLPKGRGCEVGSEELNLSQFYLNQQPTHLVCCMDEKSQAHLFPSHIFHSLVAFLKGFTIDCFLTYFISHVETGKDFRSYCSFSAARKTQQCYFYICLRKTEYYSHPKARSSFAFGLGNLREHEY